MLLMNESVVSLKKKHHNTTLFLILSNCPEVQKIFYD